MCKPSSALCAVLLSSLLSIACNSCYRANAQSSKTSNESSSADSSTEYSVRIIKVPNKGKYVPYGTQKGPSVKPRLTGTIGHDDTLDGADRKDKSVAQDKSANAQRASNAKNASIQIEDRTPKASAPAAVPAPGSRDASESSDLPASKRESIGTSDQTNAATAARTPDIDWGQSKPHKHPEASDLSTALSATTSGAHIAGAASDSREIPDNRYHGQGAEAERILSTTAVLESYETKNIAHDVYRNYIRKSFNAAAAKSSDVVVFHGKWDHAEHLLDAAGVPYSDASRSKLDQQLSRALLVVLNCPAELSESQLSSIQTFVRAGGYLVSTDWALDSSVSHMFPGYLIWKGAYSNPETVDAVPVEPDNPLLRGTSGVVPWRLDDKCEIVQLSANHPIDVLVRSRQLAKEDPNNLGILAASFVFGRGKVLHLVGHFENNNGLLFADAVPDPAPGIQISLRQAITLNFVCEALGNSAHRQANVEAPRQ